MAQKGFFYEQPSCIGCRACQDACKNVKNSRFGPLYRRVYAMESGHYPEPRIAHFSISCNHCDNPRCVQNCPTGALQKRQQDGIVTQDHDKCVGCRNCIRSCPYGAPQYHTDEHKVGKCDGCLDLLEKGRNPACVDACVGKCLHFGDMEEFPQKYGRNSEVIGLPSTGVTKPNIKISVKKFRVLATQEKRGHAS